MAFAASNNTVLISDGGLATELEARGHDLSDDLWSARLLVRCARRDQLLLTSAFYRAGAAIATTASYQASFDGFAAGGISRDDAERLMRRSVELAAAARDEVGASDRWVAASVGPYGAALANGEEYIGRYGLSVAELADWHLPRLEILADAGADVLAIETVPDIDEAEALVGLVQRLGVPAWLSYTIDGAADPRRAAAGGGVRCRDDVPEIVAVGVNCCAPGDVLPAIRDRARGDRQARHRLPQQWRGVGRARPNMGRHVAVVAGAAVAVGGRRRTHRRRLLSGDARRHCSARGDRGLRRFGIATDTLGALGVLRRQLAVLQDGVDHAVILGVLRPSGSCRDRCPCGSARQSLPV